MRLTWLRAPGKAPAPLCDIRPRGRRPRFPVPDLPRRLAALPQRFELLFLAQRIHRLPEAGVTIGGHTPFGGQPLDRPPFPNRLVVIDVVAGPARDDVEAAIDEALVGLRLLDEADDLAVLGDDAAEARRRTHDRHRAVNPGLLVKGDQVVDIDISDPV